ncbi:MAG: amino acid permease [Candidatus Omnitrophica bacterium]|nr:amino acid permease [Candidatus Omnitrophota bacterium]
MSGKVSFKRDLNWWDCSAIIVGIILGTGIFSVFPALIAQHNVSFALIMLAWIFGGLFAWFGAMCYAELSSLLPWAGGDYTFLSKAYSVKGEGLVSFLFAWAQVFVIRPSSIAVLALIFASELEKVLMFFNLGVGRSALLLAIVVVAFFTFINMIGITIGKRFQNVMTLVKILILCFIIFYGLFKTPDTPISYAPVFIPEGKSLWGVMAGFWSALVLTMWVYGGWNEAVYVAEEAKDPYRNIPKALFTGVFWSVIIYLGINLVYVRYFTPAGLAQTFNPASDLMTIWFGVKGGIIMSLVIVVSAASAIHGLILTGGRMSYAVADDFRGLKVFALLHPKRRTPGMALFANFVITILLLTLSRGGIPFVENLTFYTAGVFWYFFALVVISLIILRRKVPKEEIPFKVPFYPFLPILFLFITIGLICGSIKFKPFETLAGIAILNLGIPLYYLLSISKIHTPKVDSQS